MPLGSFKTGSANRFALVKIVAGIAIVLVLTAIYWLAQESGALILLVDGPALHDWIAGLGPWGPLAVVGSVALAILISPIPSAPIAVAAGAAFGHLWGTIYVILGAEAGALAAFIVARLFGYEILSRWFGDRLSVGWLGSQNTLMGLVFVSRLLPFLSFDLISYAAGLTALSFWRFALATVAGIIPASFLLAHFGKEMATGEARSVMMAVGALGAITLVPLLVKLLRDRLRRRNGGADPTEHQEKQSSLTDSTDRAGRPD